jgi:hypothetical protein
MSSVDRKWVLLIELVNSGKRKHYVVQDLVHTELVEALEFVFQLKTGGPNVLCAPLCFVNTKANSNFTNLIFLIIFLILLKHESRDGKPYDMMVCI